MLLDYDSCTLFTNMFCYLENKSFNFGIVVLAVFQLCFLENLFGNIRGSFQPNDSVTLNKVDEKQSNYPCINANPVFWVPVFWGKVSMVLSTLPNC